MLLTVPICLEFSCLYPTMDVDLPPAAPHPCYQNPRPTSMLKPETTFTLKYIKMASDKVPANYPYALPPVDGLYRNVGLLEFLPVPFFEFRGPGAPPADVGTPGDVYIDLTPNAHALYSKSEEDWTRWAGPAAIEMPSHPHFVDGGRARYLWFHPQQGVEWVCARTIMRRQQVLRTAGLLKAVHTASAQSSLDLASMILGKYLTGSAPQPRASTVSMDCDSDLFKSESEDESDSLSDRDTFYPSKRARRLASGTSVSAAMSISRARAPPPSSPPRHPSPDRETLQLESKLAALQEDKDLELLRSRKRELMASFAVTEHGRAKAEFSAPLLQTLEKEYHRCRPSSSVTPAEARQALPDLRCAVDSAKKTLLATKVRRVEVEKQLAERLLRCEVIRQRYPH
ncbi:hypothetical protein B0H19DRAFT_1380620 [Mycena capillaripes]|nr:hypothetical protein B0H19DRAFT_1380620 [Mycena capillaripes]